MLAVSKIGQDREFSSAIGELRRLVQDDLERVNQTLLSYLHSPVALIPEMAHYLINAGGKRLRPVLTLAAAGIFAYEGDDHIRLAAAVELIHGATLLHDDVIDESKLRRGARTANEIWGNKESVLVGDFIFSKSFELMVETGSIPVLQILSSASAVIAEGEVNQISTQNNIETTFEMYLSVVRAKTAALFAAATQIGAVIANRKNTEIDALYDYGLNLGIAYQIIDDALDYAGAAVTLGKSVGDDFKEGKITLPVILAIKMARNDDEHAFWHRTLAKGQIRSGDFDTAAALIERDDIIATTVDRARIYADRAIANLATLPKSVYTEALADIADQSVSRLS